MPNAKGRPFSPRNLVVLSDGTGNSSAKLFRTNVWRLYEALDLNCNDQLALYDDGVGTASFKPVALLGGAFGFGLKRNVLDLYSFLSRNYQVADNFDEAPSDPARRDKIFAFGFSRGGFTARVVAGLVAHQGLICAAKNDRDLDRLAKWAYRAYRVDRYRNSLGVRILRMLRDSLLRLKDRVLRNKPYDPSKNRKVDIDFLGVFDTVAAYGLPVDELTRGWDRWVWPMLPRDSSLHERVKFARQAFAINDERQTFWPLLWDEDSDREKRKNVEFRHPADRIKQVWFSGVHSNVGGGYPDDALSLTPLCWMAGEAVERGLRFQPHMLRPGESVPAEWLDRAAACAPMSDSRQGVAAYYRYNPRPIARLCGFEDHPQKRNPKATVTIDRPKIHESVFERIRDGRDSYAPFNLPDRYVVFTRKGEVLAGDPHAGNPAPNPFEHSTQAESRVREQQSAWNAVWLRRVVYFTTIATTLFLLVLPMLPLPAVPDADASPTLKQFIGAIGGFLPGFAQGFLERYQDRPGSFVIAASVVGLLLWGGSFLKGDINDRMHAVWARRKGLKSEELVPIAAQPTDWIYRLREHPLYKGTFRFMSDKVWPNVFGVAILIVLFGAIPLRLIYQIASRSESFCRPNLEAPKFERLPVGANGDVLNTAEFRFYPADICRLAGLDLKAGQKYAIQIAIPIEPTVIEGGTRKYDETKGCRGKVTGTDPKDVEYRQQFVGGWQDATIPVTSTAGIPSSPIMSVFLPFRRIWGAGWFVPIAAIGTKLPERHYLVEPAIDFTPTRNGALSLYVNDAAIPLGHLDDGWCLTWDCYYKNNSGGAAKVRVTEIDANMPAASLAPLTPFSCLEQIASVPTRH